MVKMNVKNNCFLLIFAVLIITSMAINAQPQRVISLAPHITEMVFRIGAGDRLVGRTEYCSYPPAAAEIPSIGAYLNPNYEKMVALKPDAVLIFPNAEMRTKLEQLNLKVISVSNETIAEIFSGIRQLGEFFQKTDEAAQVVSGLKDTLDWIRSQTAQWPERDALVLIGREAGSLRGLYAAGEQTYLTELVNLCHIQNAFSDVRMRYFEVSKEDLVRQQPDIIMEFRVGTAETDVAALQRDWQPLNILEAIKNDQLFIFTEKAFLIPGPRIGKTAMALYHSLREKMP